MDDEKVSSDGFSFAMGRGKVIEGLPSTPVRSAGSPAFCSTRILGCTSSSSGKGNSFSDPSATADPALNDLITHIAQQVGQTIRDQLKKECGERDDGAAQAQSSVSQPPSEPTYLNLTGAKLVLQSDVREPPVFRGDGSDKHTVCEWEELMRMYVKKRATPLQEQYQEIMFKLMGKAKDIVRITLRSTPSLKPCENPNVIYDILRQHFSDMTYSCMPMADFYSTVPVPGETPVEYWVRLNKAVDAAEESLKRLGRHMEDPCQEAAMMFVKYCPDPTLAAVFKFKAPDKWTASEIQEHVNRYQLEMKERMLPRSKCLTPVKANIQTPAADGLATSMHPGETQVQAGSNETVKAPCNDSCLKLLISLFDHALSQNNQVADKQLPPGQARPRCCRVCQSPEHSTLAHCRQKHLCLACFEPNHIKRNCPRRSSIQRHPTSQPHDTQSLN